MSSGRKPRYTLFSVGRNKASPARNASIKRASLRASVIRTEAPKLHLAFESEDAGEAIPSGSKRPVNAAPSLSTCEIPHSQRQSNPQEMKDAPLPSLPDDAAPARKPRELAFHPPPSEARTTRPPPTSSTPQPARRPAQHSATMPQPRPPQQGNFFRRLTSKIRSSSSSSPNAPSQSQSSRAAPQRKGTVLRIPKAPPPAPPPNDFTSAEQRQAALRARGLIPASSSAPRRFRDAEGFMMPLSEQEAEIDRRYTVVVPRISYEEEDAHTSEARRIREAWLAKQDGAAAPSSVPRADARASGGADASGETAPRTSDAIARASKDGAVGDRSPVRATFVRAATLSPDTGEINIGGGSLSPPPPASPLDATVEDFHTAPNSPAKGGDVLSARQSGGSADRSASPPAPARVPPNAPAAAAGHTQEPSTPSSHSSAVTEKVSRWLRTSSDTPAPTAAASSTPNTNHTHTHTSPLSESPRQSLAHDFELEHEDDETPTPTPLALSTPTGTVRVRKEKPPPIVITAHRAQDSHHTHPKAAQVIALTIAAPSDSEATSSSEGRPSLETRGRGASTGPPRLAQAVSSSSNGTTTTRTTATTTSTSTSSGSGTTGGRSRTNTVPALSPTRTVSSSGASSSLPTPTTTSCVRDASISRGSTSHSFSDGGHETHVRPRRGTTAKSKAPGGVIMEEYSETEPSSEGGEGEFGAKPLLPPPSTLDGVAVPPQAGGNGRAQVLEAHTKANGRISFSLFGKKSLDSQMPRETRTSSSMMNLRRAFTSSKARPKSTLALSPVAEHGQGQGQGVSELGVVMGRKKSKMFDASHLPASPTYPPSAFPSNPSAFTPRHSTSSSVSSNGKTTGVGLRPRQAVAPTMHSRGSILHQAHFIQDEESRRLSEMAFLT